MSCSIKGYSFVYVLSGLILFVNSGPIVSDVEKHLEKFGTRIGKNEFVSVFKGPPTGKEKLGKTFVLLSKLYEIPPNRNGELSDVIKLSREQQLKFRSPFPAITSVVTERTPQEDMIHFPKEETSTRKTSHYNTNFPTGKTLSSVTPFQGWKLPESHNHGKDGAGTSNTYRRFGYPLLHRLAQQPEPVTKALPENPPINLGNEMSSTSQEDLSWYTLITVPGKGKKNGDGCPTGQRKDHNGICRATFAFNGSADS